MKRLDFLKSLIGIPVAAKVLTESTPKEIDLKDILGQAKKNGIIRYDFISSDSTHFSVLPSGNLKMTVPTMKYENGSYFQLIGEDVLSRLKQ